VRVKATPYDDRPSEKVVYPAVLQALVVALLAVRRGLGDRATLAAAACTAITTVVGFGLTDLRFEALRCIVVSTAERAKEGATDGWDGDRPDERPPELTEADQHPPEARWQSAV
jgi:hypothetical protein